jgi:murein DD-endopeptidase MepM/ murein hydrolase activator NlpD
MGRYWEAMRRVLSRPWVLAAIAAAMVVVPVAGATVLAGEESAKPPAPTGKQRADADIDRLIAQGRSRAPARALEPTAGLPEGVVVEAGATDFPVATPSGAAKPDRVSAGAPSDAQIRAELEDLEREQARIERVILNSSAPIRRGSGRFIWPINGSFTSPFGQRWGRLHAGIDLAAPTGTAIRAADTGQVVLAGPYGGYGNYTCIRHTRTVSTCYGHQSRILVGVGDVVTQGQVIGAVGSTGHSTGPHLHFEVRISGKPVDPMAYL